MEFKTDRLVIREFQDSDVASLVKYLNNLNVSKFLLKVPHPYTEDDAKWWVNHCKEQQAASPRENYGLAVELEGELVGGIGLEQVDEWKGTAEIGLWLAEPFWSRGIMSEAVPPMLDFAFGDLGLRRINWFAWVDNDASCHLAEKFGFTCEGTLREDGRSKATGEIRDSVVYGLLKREWKGSQ